VPHPFEQGLITRAVIYRQVDLQGLVLQSAHHSGIGSAQQSLVIEGVIARLTRTNCNVRVCLVECPARERTVIFVRLRKLLLTVCFVVVWGAV